jgi:hypothetical protein
MSQTKEVKPRKMFACSVCGPCSGHTKRSHTNELVALLSLGPERIRHHLFGTLMPRFEQSTQEKVKDTITNQPVLCNDWKGTKGRVELMMYCPGRKFIALVLHYWSYIEAHKLSAEVVFYWAESLCNGKLDCILTSDGEVPSDISDYKQRAKESKESTPIVYTPKRHFTWNRPLNDIVKQMNGEEQKVSTAQQLSKIEILDDHSVCSTLPMPTTQERTEIEQNPPPRASPNFVAMEDVMLPIPLSMVMTVCAMVLEWKKNQQK